MIWCSTTCFHSMTLAAWKGTVGLLCEYICLLKPLWYDSITWFRSFGPAYMLGKALWGFYVDMSAKTCLIWHSITWFNFDSCCLERYYGASMSTCLFAETCMIWHIITGFHSFAPACMLRRYCGASMSTCLSVKTCMHDMALRGFIVWLMLLGKILWGFSVHISICIMWFHCMTHATLKGILGLLCQHVCLPKCVW